MSSTWTLIDTETDGLFAPIHVIDVAAQKFDGLTPVGEPFQVYINHEVSIPPEATAVHGYTTEFIRKHGIHPGTAYRGLRSYIGTDPVVSHNVSFDWDRVLVPEWTRLREEPIGQRGFCALLLSRRALPEHSTHRLDYLRDFHSLACSRPHSALGDVEATADLLTRIIFPRLAAIGYGSIAGIREFVSLRPVLRCRCLIEGLNYEEEAQRIRAARRTETPASRRFRSGW